MVSDDAPGLLVSISRVDETLPLPAYSTPGSVGFDLLARQETAVPPRQITRVPANVIVATPPGYALLIASRSGTPVKKGLSPPHGIGIVDQDFQGPEDEILVQVYNFTDQMVTIERGERIAQGLFVRVDRARWCERPVVPGQNRGGFGSTGDAD